MTQRSIRIFISHSAHAVDEPATQRFLDRLTKRIKAMPGFDTLTDQKDLAAGDAWLQRLYTWMGLCDAAVILLSPRAVLRENSSWVPRETNLLLWRKALDPRFIIVPVLLGDVTPEDVANNPFMTDIRLADLQLARGLSDTAKIGQIVKALHDKLSGAVTRLAFDPVRAHVEYCISRHASDSSVNAALLTHYGQDGWLPATAPHQNLSLQMIRQAAADSIDRVIADVTLGSLGEERLGMKLFDALFPMRLPAEPACRLLALCREQEGRGAVLVNANDIWVLRMLLCAATGILKQDLQRTWQMVELPDGWGDDDQAEIERFLAEELAEAALGTGGWESLSDHPDPAVRLQEQYRRLAEQLQEARRETGAPILVCARYTQRWAQLVATLSAQFPSTVFLLWSGDELPADNAHSTACQPLAPTWPGGEDRRWKLSYRRKSIQFGGTGP